MKPANPIDACPDCGGKGGFQTTVVCKATRVIGWDGADVDTESYILASEKNPKCSDCGKSVRSLFKAK